MSSVVIAGDTSGSVTLQAPSVAGTTVLTLPATSGTVITTTGGVAPGTAGNVLTSNGTTWTSAANNKLTIETSQSMVGTNAALFTGIPSWVKRITICTYGSNASPSIRVGTSSGIVATGYVSVVYSALSGNQTSSGSSTTQFATQANDGSFILYNVTGNTWLAVGNHANSGNRGSIASGNITLSDALTQLQLIGTYTTGTINILYE